jgi:hypothetical protein
VLETPDFWVVYVGRVPATVIPRTFMSAEDDATLKAFLDDQEMVQGR